ncbi:SseB family protein [Nocardioides speluncae]|uniref:SseB family protein n=1 Tax=Nocardioides speluncae TaxID=2670337 RepID=UPI000D69DB23|nr:SseB family protein [Nocardioides speluncae]
MSAPQRFAGSRILPSGFADDDGAAPAALATALAAYAADPARKAEALAALQASRLLVPVVALLGEVEYDDAGLAHDKSSDMAAVLMQGRDGRLALLAFTGLDPLRAWNPEARPVPVTAQVAAQSALQDQAAAIVLDIAGPATLVIEGEDLLGIASGWTIGRVGDRSAWIRPADA